jgi:hypothetical protein
MLSFRGKSGPQIIKRISQHSSSGRLKIGQTEGSLSLCLRKKKEVEFELDTPLPISSRETSAHFVGLIILVKSVKSKNNRSVLFVVGEVVNSSPDHQFAFCAFVDPRTGNAEEILFHNASDPELNGARQATMQRAA